MNNILSVKNNILFLSAILIAGTLSMMIPTTTFAQSYEDLYGKDQKSTGLNKQNVNCNNIIINGVNSADHGTSDMLGGMTNEEGYDGTWQEEGQWLSNGDKKALNDINNNIVNFCKNKNNQVVEGTATLSVAKTISCTPEENVPVLNQACDAITTGAVVPEAQIFPEDFTISVTGNNPNPSLFHGSNTQVAVKLGAGEYEVSETPDEDAINDAIDALDSEFVDIVLVDTTTKFSGDCTQQGDSMTAVGNIAEGELQTCNIDNEFKVSLPLIPIP